RCGSDRRPRRWTGRRIGNACGVACAWRTVPTPARSSVLRARGGHVNIDRSVLFIAEFDEVYHAHAAQRRRALERLGAKVAVFDLKSRPTLVERLRAGDLGKRLERCIDEVQPDLVLVNGNEAIDE